MGATTSEHNRFEIGLNGFARVGLSHDAAKVSLRCGSVDSNAIETVQNKCMGSGRAALAERRDFPQHQAFPRVVRTNKNCDRWLQRKGQ